MRLTVAVLARSVLPLALPNVDRSASFVADPGVRSGQQRRGKAPMPGPEDDLRYPITKVREAVVNFLIREASVGMLQASTKQAAEFQSLRFPFACLVLRLEQTFQCRGCSTDDEKVCA